MTDPYRELETSGCLVADAVVSAGVVISGLVVWQTGWSWIDPIASLAVSVVILIGTLRLLREATDLLLDAVPPHVDPDAVSTYLATVPDRFGIGHVTIQLEPDDQPGECRHAVDGAV